MVFQAACVCLSVVAADHLSDNLDFDVMECHDLQWLLCMFSKVPQACIEMCGVSKDDCECSCVGCVGGRACVHVCVCVG